jgi:hypothetical protein
MGKANVIISYELPLERFNWHPKDGSLTAFESDLRSHKFDGTYPWLRQIWNDSCDIGIAIHSHVTHKVELFYLEKEHVRDGDLTHWTFKPVSNKHPVKSVTIFND